MRDERTRTPLEEIERNVQARAKNASIDMEASGAVDRIAARHHHVADPALGAHPGRQSLETLAVDDGHGRTGVVERVAHLLGHPPGVQAHHDRTDALHRPERERELGVVAHADGHPVALLHTVRHQPRGERVHRAVSIRERDGLVSVDEVRAVAECGGPQPLLAQGSVRVAEHTPRKSVHVGNDELEMFPRRGQSRHRFPPRQHAGTVSAEAEHPRVDDCLGQRARELAGAFASVIADRRIRCHGEFVRAVLDALALRTAGVGEIAVAVHDAA